MKLPTLLKVRAWAQLKIINYWQKEFDFHTRPTWGCVYCSKSQGNYCTMGEWLFNHLTEEMDKL